MYQHINFKSLSNFFGNAWSRILTHFNRPARGKEWWCWGTEKIFNGIFTVKTWEMKKSNLVNCFSSSFHAYLKCMYSLYLKYSEKNFFLCIFWFHDTISIYWIGRGMAGDSNICINTNMFKKSLEKVKKFHFRFVTNSTTMKEREKLFFSVLLNLLNDFKFKSLVKIWPAEDIMHLFVGFFLSKWR